VNLLTSKNRENKTGAEAKKNLARVRQSVDISLVGPVYPYRGGIAHHTACLAQALEKAGHGLQVVSFRKQYPAWLYPGASDHDPSRQPIRTPASFVLDPFSPATWAKTVQEITASRSMVVIQWWVPFWGVPFAWLTHCLRQRGRRVIFMVHNVLPHEPHLLGTWLAKTALHQGDAFLVHSRGERARLAALLPGVRVIQYVPHPVYDLFTSGRKPPGLARRLLNLPENRKVLLFFGMVRPYKGLDLLLDALGRLQVQGEIPFLLVAGECWGGAARYRQQIIRLGLQGHVRLDDCYIPNEEVGLYFSAADCLAAPYLSATQSGVIGLAEGFGLPVLASLAAALPWEDYSGIRIVPTGDTAALAQAIRQWQAQPIPASTPVPAAESWSRLVQALEELA
jgi:glycosyltransferase involved in cell wall biosynthesis